MPTFLPEALAESATSAKPVVYYLARDLFFSVRFAEGLAHLGTDARPITATPIPALQDGALLLVDLSSPQTQWQPLIEAARLDGVPVLAFGSHMDQPRWKLARAAGADHVVANSHLVEHFPELVGRMLRKPAS